jgi:hypothetical protein
LTEINIGLGQKDGRRLTKLVALKTGRSSILMSDKVDFKLTLVKQDKGQIKLIKGQYIQRK